MSPFDLSKPAIILPQGYCLNGLCKPWQEGSSGKGEQFTGPSSVDPRREAVEAFARAWALQRGIMDVISAGSGLAGARGGRQIPTPTNFLPSPSPKSSPRVQPRGSYTDTPMKSAEALPDASRALGPAGTTGAGSRSDPYRGIPNHNTPLQDAALADKWYRQARENGGQLGRFPDLDPGIPKLDVFPATDWSPCVNAAYVCGLMDRGEPFPFQSDPTAPSTQIRSFPDYSNGRSVTDRERVQIQRDGWEISGGQARPPVRKQ